MEKNIRKSLKDKAYYSIKKDIITFRYKPGEALPEEQLSKELGISRTPIREALKELQYNGLVRTIPGKGAFVAELTVQDIHEVFFLRQVLEVAALRVTIQNCRKEDLLPLKRVFSAALDKKLNQNDYEALFQSDVSLHNFIVKTAGNRRLSEFFAILSDQIERIRRTSARLPGRMEKSLQEHRGILEAIEARDVEKAERILTMHLENVKNSALAISGF
ncbi:MAG: GntR family transcriptional regulator [Firmicutes bacterium]|nr:GntR family transcriptional regulator [Bacillota bacterium]